MKRIIELSVIPGAALFLAALVSCGGGKREASGPAGVVETSAPGGQETSDRPGAAGGRSMTQRIVALESGEEIGTRTVLVTREGDAMTVAESLNVSLGGRDLGLNSTVTLSGAPPVEPVSATAETTSDGKTCMKASVAFMEWQVEVSATLLAHGSGEDIDPPRKIERSIPLPPGTVVFHSALLAVGPLLLPRGGELENLVLAEFPDDIDEPINLKKDYRLVRTDREDGGCEIRLYSPHEEEPVYSIDLDPRGRCLSETAFQKFKFIPEPEPD